MSCLEFYITIKNMLVNIKQVNYLFEKEILFVAFAGALNANASTNAIFKLSI